MGWLKRIFGIGKKEETPQQSVQSVPRASAPAASAGTTASTQTIPPERVGLDGEYDESGLAKRVALAFDNDPGLDDIETLWVAQTGGTVVLKGTVPDRDILNTMVAVARDVSGATSVDTQQVEVG
ncbi:MAG: BON domain-containing protein [Cyanobacteriota bacterium]|nr:BON domain-containing protein [Cyanobacteriota bacterium]